MVPQPQLDASSTLPIYRQLYAHFTNLIQSGQLANGDRLPATRELAGSLGLNRTTVAAAYELLESEGFINGQVGRGSFVTVQHPATPNRPLDWSHLLGRSTPSP